MEILELQKVVDEISPAELAGEFLDWLIKNVEQYVDNHKTKFILNISPKEAGGMPIAERVETLYQALDGESVEISIRGDSEFDWSSLDEATQKSVEEETSKLMILHTLVEKAYQSMLNNEKRLSELFKRIAFYYELIGFRNGIPIEKQIGGAVHIDTFHYEAVSVPVEIKGRVPVFDENNELVGMKETESSTYMIPPSFVIDLDFELLDKRTQTSLF